jgi:hypothetical protein
VLRLAGVLLVTIVTRLARLRVTWLAVARLAMLLTLTWLLTLAFSFLVLVHFQTSLSSGVESAGRPGPRRTGPEFSSGRCPERAAERLSRALLLVRY